MRGRVPPGPTAVIVPASTGIRPAASRNRVDLPHPFSPIIPVTPWAGTVTDTLVSTRWVLKETDTPSKRRWAKLAGMIIDLEE
jgi:hypothetical protein